MCRKACHTINTDSPFPAAAPERSKIITMEKKDIIPTITDAVRALQGKQKLKLIAIDGRCAAGKTTLAAHLQEIWDCPVIHMDDFFLRPEQRTETRLRKPGENVDYERFLLEVMTPLRAGASFRYFPYDCQTKELAAPVSVTPKNIVIIEGSYSCHPALWENYDLKIFLSIDGESQLQRIRKRNGDAALNAFREKWIPLEELYFSAYRIEEHCDLRFPEFLSV